MKVHFLEVGEGGEIPSNANIIETTDITKEDSVGKERKLRIWYTVPYGVEE